MTQKFFLFYSDIAQVGSKQVVKEKRMWANRKGYLNEQEGLKTVLFMGNSHIASGIMPEVFDEANDYNTHSYNLALVGLQIPSHYFMMKDYLKNHAPPDFIMVDPNEGGFQVESFPSYSIQGAGLLEVIQYAYYRKNIDVLLNYIIPSRVHWPEVARYFFGKTIQLFPQNIRDKHKEIYMNRFGDKEIYGHNREYFYESQYVDPEGYMKRSLELLRKERGYYFIIEQAKESNVVTDEYIKTFFPEAYAQYLKEGSYLEPDEELFKWKRKDQGRNPSRLPPFIKKFFNLTQKYNIKVILMQDYVLNIFEGDKSYSDLWKKIQENYDHVFILKNMLKSQKYGFKYFSDPGHLNRLGAVEHTKRVAKGFKDLMVELEKSNE